MVIAIGAIYGGVMVAIWVCMGLGCKFAVAMRLAGFWSVVWVGKPDLPIKPHAERTAASKRDIDRSLNVFNCAFITAMQI